ncbi:ferritin-like domain-containing protein [Halorussus halophilus]|uniref:ferritin-like domain-containing protein n=1 Tax=Halorussus halophilus TaxID=2650975 RepID=UPI001787FED0|nr:ferritin-like domain-containing protein [Halorussus halophilus]
MRNEINDFEIDGGDEGGNSSAENGSGSADSRREFLKKGFATSAIGFGLSAGSGAATGAQETTQGTVTTEEGRDDQRFVDTLNYALTLERLEATFYRRGLQEFSEDDLVNSRIGQRFGEEIQSSMYQRFEEIRDHEQAHVQTLTQTVESLGGDPVTADDVEFQFDLRNPRRFIRTAQTLETTGVSAYDGAIDTLSGNGELITAAASIATVEARHSSYLNTLTRRSPFPSAFDEPLEPDEVLELVQPFVVSDTMTTTQPTTTQ